MNGIEKIWKIDEKYDEKYDPNFLDQKTKFQWRVRGGTETFLSFSVDFLTEKRANPATLATISVKVRTDKSILNIFKSN